MNCIEKLNISTSTSHINHTAILQIHFFQCVVTSGTLNRANTFLSIVSNFLDALDLQMDLHQPL